MQHKQPTLFIAKRKHKQKPCWFTMVWQIIIEFSMSNIKLKIMSYVPPQYYSICHFQQQQKSKLSS